MNIYASPGAKVRFTGEGGYPGQAERARERLEVGRVYTVHEIDVENWVSYVTLAEIEGEYNTVLFEDAQ